MVIALLLSSVILVIIASTMNLAIKSEEKGIKRQDSSQHIRVISSQIIFLIKGAYPYIATINGKKRYYFEGKPDSLSFITSSVTKNDDTLRNEPGLKWVRIFRDSDGLKMMENFFFLDEDYEGGSAKKRLLDDTVTEIDFEYLDRGEDRDKEPEWKDSWSTDDDKYLPAAVKVSIMVQGEDKGKEIKLPPFTVRIQNSKKIN